MLRNSHLIRKAAPLTLLFVGAWLLGSCAPTSSTGASGPPPKWTEAEIQAICAAQPRVVNQGTLSWGSAEEDYSLPAPYQLTCPNMAFSNPAGTTVTVQANSLQAALALFAPEADLLAYFPDLYVRFPEPGLITLDAPTDLSEAMQNDLEGVEITLTPAGGQKQVLLRASTPVSVRLDPTQAFTITIRAQHSPVSWPQVYIDPAKGLIRATQGK